MRIVFAGTPPFSVTALERLIAAKHEIACVYTQPDRKTGRGQKMIPPAVKVCAEQHNIPVRQPLSLKSTQAEDELTALQADLMVVVAYGMLLPQAILTTPRYGCLNIHASLLPKWRGAAPIQRALEAGDKETGVCIMQMDVGLDTGDILSQANQPITINDTSSTLHDKLSTLGADTLITTIDKLTEYQSQAIQQCNEHSTYAKKITKAEANIDWTQSHQEIDYRIRAFNPWPVCQTTLDQQRTRIWFSAQASDQTANQVPGSIISLSEQGIEVACGSGSVYIKTLQRDGGKPLDHKEFLNGQTLNIGQQFV